MNISRETMEEMCVGFIQYVYNETQTEGWSERRRALITGLGFSEYQYGKYDCDEYEDHDEKEDLGTFQEIMMARYKGDLNKTLQHFFCYESDYEIERCSKYKWFVCYCIQQKCPEVMQLVEKILHCMAECDLCRIFNRKFSDWLWRDAYKDIEEIVGSRYLLAKKKVTEKIKDILALDICLK
jgi:hypothetical protein